MSREASATAGSTGLGTGFRTNSAGILAGTPEVEEGVAKIRHALPAAARINTQRPATSSHDGRRLTGFRAVAADIGTGLGAWTIAGTSIALEQTGQRTRLPAGSPRTCRLLPHLVQRIGMLISHSLPDKRSCMVKKLSRVENKRRTGFGLLVCEKFSLTDLVERGS